MGPPRRNNNTQGQNQNHQYYQQQQQPQNVPSQHPSYNGNHSHSPKGQRTQQRQHRQQRSITSPPPFSSTPPPGQYSGNRSTPAPTYSAGPSTTSAPTADYTLPQNAPYQSESDITRARNDASIITHTTAVVARPGSAVPGQVTIMPNFLPEPNSNNDTPREGAAGATMTATSRYNHNLKVLRRRDASIMSIFDQFSHVCVYHHNGEKWEKQGYEGSMFLYERNSYPPYGFFILNRMGREDYIQQLYPEDDITASGSYVMVRSFPEFTQRRMAAAQAAGLCGPTHMFSDIHSLETVKKKVKPEEGKGMPQIIGLWTYATDSREPMMDVMSRLHSFIKASKRYPDEYRYGPDRPPPPNPHARNASASPALPRALPSTSQTTQQPQDTFGTPSMTAAVAYSTTSAPASSSSSMDSMTSNISNITELDKLFAKLAPTPSSSILPSGSPQIHAQAPTPKVTLDSLFAAAAAATPSLEEAKSSPALGPANVYGSNAPSIATPPIRPATVTQPTGLPLLDSIFASADPQAQTQPQAQPRAASSQHTHPYSQQPHHQPSPLLSQAQAQPQPPPQRQQHQSAAASQGIPIYSPKPTTTSLPQILNEDVISGLLSRSGSTAPGANAFAPTSSSRLGSRSRAGSVNLLAPGELNKPSFNNLNGRAKGQSQQQFDGDMTPRAPPPSDIPPVMTDSPGPMDTQFLGNSTPGRSQSGQTRMRSQSRSQSKQYSQQQQSYQSQGQVYHSQSHSHHRSESSSSITFEASSQGQSYHQQQTTRTTSTTVETQAYQQSAAGAAAAASANTPAKQRVRPPHERNLVPFRDDSELWPYPRAPLDDRGDSDEEKGDGSRAAGKDKGKGKAKANNNGDQPKSAGYPYKEERNDEGDDEDDNDGEDGGGGEGDSEEIIELDFSDIRALSDPSMLEKVKKNNNANGKGKGKEKRKEKESGAPSAGSGAGAPGLPALQHGGHVMVPGRGRGRGRGGFIAVPAGHAIASAPGNPNANANAFNGQGQANRDDKAGAKSRKRGKKERAAERDRMEREVIESSWDFPDQAPLASTSNSSGGFRNDNNNGSTGNNNGYKRVLGTPPPPASPSPPPVNEDDAVVIEKLARAFNKNKVGGGGTSVLNSTMGLGPAATNMLDANNFERPASAVSNATNGSARSGWSNGDVSNKVPVNGGSGRYGVGPSQQQGDNLLDQASAREGLINVFNEARASGRSGVHPGVRLEKNEFMRELLTLIQTDHSFVDNLWQEYLARTGGYALHP
ncbi:hypothetical protein AX16_010340 [Volvariella volvacea WC 439]|nr:hypothetical protein AX16_010340 [Volvariella volvacea WC 439]